MLRQLEDEVRNTTPTPLPNARSSEVALAMAVSESPEVESEAEAEPVEDSIETQISVHDEKERNIRSGG